jgi:hypothetical protein
MGPVSAAVVEFGGVMATDSGYSAASRPWSMPMPQVKS